MTSSFFSRLARLYFHLSIRRRWQFTGLTGLMVVGAFAELATLGAIFPFLGLLSNPDSVSTYPWITKLLGAFGVDTDSELALHATLLFCLIAALAALVRIALNWFSLRLIFAVGVDLGVDVYRRTLHQPYCFHVARNTSEIISGLVKVQLVIFNIISPFVHCVVALVLSFAILSALLAINAAVAIAAGISLGAIYVLVTLLTRRYLVLNGQTVANNETHRIQIIQEGLGGIRDVLLDNAQEEYVKRFLSVERELRIAQASNSFVSTSPRFLIEALGMIIIAALAFQMSASNAGFSSAIPTLGALALGAQRLMPQLQQVYYAVSTLSANHQILTDVLELLDMPLTSSTSRKLKPLVPLENGIYLKDIRFRYSDSSPEVLCGIDLFIQKGWRIGFIGKTGSGKSTLVDLLMGLLLPTSGRIELDDVALQDLGIGLWQSRVAHVPQSVYLSDATIAENIAFGTKFQNIDMDRVVIAARLAQIADFIDSLPQTYMTDVGERGVRLSGGQRQRIGLARALYKKADVLVLDEATSALDDATEDAVISSVESMGRDVTVVMIAHRLTTLRGCDLIVELDAGRIVWMGTYSALTERSLKVSTDII
jgi:ATP-binding cassette, subfamily B, bacterial PglK